MSSENFIEAERAIIIWDEPHKTEHFIRQASIRTSSPDLGFLVPTPQTPELSEVDPQMFDMASTVSKPESTPPVIYHTPWDAFSPFVVGLKNFFTVRSFNYGPTKRVTPAFVPNLTGIKPSILFEKDIAGYHATVLATDDFQSIAAWLGSNGYASTPELEKWLKSYAVKKWKITAFKLIQDPNHPTDGTLTTRAIRLSFATDSPFYPYSEPSDRQKAAAASPAGRALRLTILSNHRMTGNMADKSVWPGKLEFAGPSTPLLSASASSPQISGTERQWLTYANLDDSKHNTDPPTYLTTFLDESNPRLGTADLYFSLDAVADSYRATKADYSLPVQERLDVSKPISDLAGLLVILVIPAIPLYGGWRTLFATRHEYNFIKASRQLSSWWHIGDKLLGSIAILLGTLVSIPFGLGFVTGLFSFFQEPAMLFVSIICFLFLMLCVATVHCGFKLLRGNTVSKDGKFSELPPFVRRWNKIMSICSITAGVCVFVGLLIVMLTNGLN